MREVHLAYLNLGSNIQPETNLPKALEMLSRYGEITAMSNVWESEAVGTQGPNYLNMCILFQSGYSLFELKDTIIRSTEETLGRIRSRDKFAPRTMDIDIILYDDQPLDEAVWELAYIVIPLADIYPGYRVPNSGIMISETATHLRRQVWLEMRRGIAG
jgi:2-amino-4-hydroxy-6-hydroxymethyldihydropteridine diphosphokinase